MQALCATDRGKPLLGAIAANDQNQKSCVIGVDPVQTNSLLSLMDQWGGPPDRASPSVRPEQHANPLDPSYSYTTIV